MSQRPTDAEIQFVLEQVQYGYESHLDWEQYFRTHQCTGNRCKACAEAKLLGDADFHAEQKRRYETELRVLQWFNENCQR